MQLFHFTPQQNVDRILSEGLQPMIGPRSEAFGETVPQIYCFTCMDAVGDALANWFGDAFDVDDVISLLKIDARSLSVDISANCQWEARIGRPIDPGFITLVGNF